MYIITKYFYVNDFADNPSILATIIEIGTVNVQEWLTNRGVFLWPIQPIQRVVFECISSNGNGQIYLSSLNQSSNASRIEFNQFPTSLNGFLVCFSNTSGRESRVYIASEYKNSSSYLFYFE